MEQRKIIFEDLQVAKSNSVCKTLLSIKVNIQNNQN